MRTYKIPMENGEVDATLNIGAQAKLSRDHHDLWVRYNNIYKKMGGEYVPSEIEMGQILYTAYVCANMDSDYMSEDDFLMNLSDDREATGRAFQNLFGVKEQEKKQDSQMHFKKLQNEKRRR